MSSLCKRSKLRSLFREHHGEEFRRPAITAIPRDRVHLAWRFQEHLTGGIGLFRLISDFRPDFPFENVRNGDPGMAVRRRTFARLIRDLQRGNRPVIQGEIRKIVFENNPIAALGLRFYDLV